MRALLIIVTIFVVATSYAQDYVYCITRTGPSDWYFSKVDRESGVNTLLTPLAFDIWGDESVTMGDSVYYMYKSGGMYAIDPNTGVIFDTYDLGFQESNEGLYCLAYHPCEHVIYCFARTIDDEWEFARYTPATHTLEYIAVMPFAGLVASGQTFIDPQSNLFYYEEINSMYTISLSTGSVVSNVVFQDLPDENFSHIAIHCSDKLIYGTSANSSEGKKYFSKVDPITGEIIHVSESWWTAGLLKPSGSNYNIDQDAGVFMYSGQGGVLVQIDVNSGSLLQSDVVGVDGYDITSLEIMHADCDCETIESNSEVTTENILLSPNPFNNILYVSAITAHQYLVQIFDVRGIQIQQEFIQGNTQIRTASLAPGIYTVLIKDIKTNTQHIQKLMKVN